MLQARAFEFEQAPLQCEAPTEAAERSIAGDDAVARNNDRDRIRATSCADSANSFRLADPAGDPRVGTRFAARDRAQSTPDFLLEWRAGRKIETAGESHRLTTGVGLELAREFPGRDREVAPTKVQAAQATLRKLRAQRAELGSDCYRTTA